MLECGRAWEFWYRVNIKANLLNILTYAPFFQLLSDKSAKTLLILVMQEQPAKQ